MGWPQRIFGKGQSAEASPKQRSVRITASNPLVIESPRIGFLNFLGSSAQAILDEDKAALVPLFASAEENNANPPVCDVLMIYARVETNGRVAGSSDALREIIHKSHAPIVIVASENEGKNYVAAGKQTGYGHANLVMTLARRGNSFPTFLTKLFRRMFEGKSMPLAWVELAPQGPVTAHASLPSTIFAAEVSHIVFR